MDVNLQIIRVIERATLSRVPLSRLHLFLKRYILESGWLDPGMGLRYNCRYRPQDLIGATVYTSLECSALHLGCDKLRSLGCGVPTSRWVLENLSGKSLGWVVDRVNHAIAAMLKPHGLLRGPVTVAVDLHYDPYYGAKDDPYVVGGRLKASTARFHKFATAYVVEEGLRFTLAATMVAPGEDARDVLERLLRQAELIVPVRRVLGDADFFNVPCIRLLDSMGKPWTIHGNRTSGVKRVLGELEPELPREGDCTLADYTLESSKYGEASIKLLVVREKGGGPLQVFGVSRSEGRRPAKLYREFKGRFGIDTSYRLVGKVESWTTSKSPSVRMFLFGLSILLQNLWVLVKALMDTSSRGGAPRQEAPKREERLEMMMGFLKLVFELSGLLTGVVTM